MWASGILYGLCASTPDANQGGADQHQPHIDQHQRRAQEAQRRRAVTWPVEAAFEPLQRRPVAVPMRFIQMYDIISALFSMDTFIRGIEVRGDAFGRMSAVLNYMYRYILGTHPAGTIPIEFVHACATE